ncbi:MAG TPA: metallophosphoesterase [Paenalcaligenes sp.]|nr:metallophosphoesterase [Paenalcaligenes sp.]
MELHRRLLFLLTPPIITLIGHLYVAQRLSSAWTHPVWKTSCWVGVLLMYVGITAGFLIRHDHSTPFNDRVSWIAFTLLGLFSWLFVLTLIRDVAMLGLGLADVWSRFGPDTGLVFKRYSAFFILAVSLIATLIGFFNARSTPHIVNVDITIPDLPPELKGFTLTQITDLHVGPTIKKDFVRRVVDTANDLNSDVIVLTGDLIDGDVEGLRPHTQLLAELSAPLGVYAVTGNHEYYSGAPRWIAEYERLGMRVLQNEHVVLPYQQGQLLLAGVNDYDAGRFDSAWASDPHAAIHGAPDDVGAKILLAHQPRSMQEAAAAGFDLQISGHTHGGQFWPWGYFVRLQQPFVAGLDHYEDLQIYTSQGTGYWGPPMRVGARSEITRIRLK